MPPKPPSDSASASRTEPSSQEAKVQVDSGVLGSLIGRLSGRQRSAGRYQVEDEVARGGMGAIYRVLDVDLRRRLAMKVVLERGDGQPVDERLIGRFAEEAQITGQLEHPGIVPVHDLGLDEQGRMFFTMRLVRGRDFEKILEVVHSGEDEEWTLTRAVGVLLKASEAMAYAHSKHVIHRDLKPANIMVGRFGEVYVMDWGLARLLETDDDPESDLAPQAFPVPRVTVRTDREDVRESGEQSAMLTMIGDVMGTAAYMSPEQARGDLKAMGPASDVYSMGGILYHVLAGHMPFGARGEKFKAADIWQQLRAGPPPSIEKLAPNAPPELSAICERAMAREIDDRYHSMVGLSRDLRAYLEGRVVGAYETGAVAEFRKWVSRNKALAMTALVAGVLIFGGSTLASVVLASLNGRLIERTTTVLRLSDITQLQQLVESADTLWPAHPENSAALRDWLGGTRDLLAHEQEHRDELARLREKASEAQEGRYTFTNTADQWQHDTLVDLLAGLEQLDAPEVGLVADVEARLEFSEAIEERSRSGASARAGWDRAVAAIAASPHYSGLELPPQLGLLPLGPDPVSELWEFAHMQTGTAPVRGADGKLVLTEESGLVFVLLPGGFFIRGDPIGPTGDENAAVETLELDLAPFFISKYEMSQGQWQRFSGDNPSSFLPGEEFGGHRVDLLYPVEQVTWFECHDALQKLALQLPSEAQWEYATRASSEQPPEDAWWTGAERESLRGRVNLADRSAARIGVTWPAVDDWKSLDDGYPVTAPVNAFEPNAFGLFNVAGNVWEWCAEPYAVGYGEQVTANHTMRGGSFKHTAALARSSYRNPTSPDARTSILGLRPARALAP